MKDILQTHALPVVVYVAADGEMIHLSSGENNQQGITSKVEQLIILSDYKIDQTTTLNLPFKVLADASGGRFADRKVEIMKRFKDIDTKSTVTFSQKPQLKAPYVAGSMTSKYQQNALRTLNLVRYLSGLPEVVLSSEYNSYAQHGAVLMAASSFGHYPKQPSNMGKDFYKLGYKGTSEGNIGMGYTNLYNAIINGWMSDEDQSNIDRVGHRRWILNPSMKATGFGEFNRMSTMYAVDDAATPPEFDAIAYPSGSSFPSELFRGNYPWHVTLNPYIFEKPTIENVTVTLSGGGKTFFFSHKNSSFNGNYFNIDRGGYGIDNSIIFRPSGITEYSGTYKVQINGIKTLMGIEVSLNYETTFFNASINYTEDLPSSWAQKGIERANQSNLLPESLNSNFTMPITRAEFSQLAVKLYENKKGPIQATAEFNDTSDLNVRKIATLGIVHGTSNGLFSPNDKITREQAAKILDLLLDALEQPQDHRSVYFTDQSDISQWAREHVKSVSNRGIMGDVGQNRFDPKGLFTREQSMITLLRVHDLITSSGLKE